MGSKVLSVESSDSELRAYAHCSPSEEGTFTLLLVNLNQHHQVTVNTAIGGTHDDYVITADALTSLSIRLNGNILKLDATGKVPPLTPQREQGATITLPAASYAFITHPGVATACK